jgi:dephospho-CoA kinase
VTHASKVIAITGGIGSGKSCVAKLFEQWGAQTVDADILAREVVEPGTEGFQRVVDNFGEDMILADGSLNRPKLASIIFSDPEKKKLLETLVHPLIRERWLRKLEQLKQTNAPIIAYIVPLFFESTAKMSEIEKVVLVSAPEEMRIARIMVRDIFPLHIAEQRIKAQLPDSAKIDKSDYVINNDCSMERLESRARAVFGELVGNKYTVLPVSGMPVKNK